MKMANYLSVPVCGDDGLIREWIEILSVGQHIVLEATGPFASDPRDNNIINDRFRDRRKHLEIEYFYQSPKGDRDLVAGWIKDLAVLEDGLWAQVEYTEAAKKAIMAGECNYLSPMFLLDPKTRQARALWRAYLIKDQI